MWKTIIFTLCIHLFLTSSALAIESVSMVELIASGSKYDGKRVRVIGFASVKFEDTALYYTKEVYDAGMSKSAVWLNLFKNKKIEEPKQFDKKYILVEGTFDKNAKGHMGSFSGTVKDITRMQIWHTR